MEAEPAHQCDREVTIASLPCYSSHRTTATTWGNALPVMGWVSIGVAIGGAVFSVLMWLLTRRWRRMDALELAVFGDGVNPGIHKFVTHAVMNERINEMKSSLQGISEEGVRREERILAAIENVRDFVGSEVIETKTIARQLNQRFDEALAAASRNQR